MAEDEQEGSPLRAVVGLGLIVVLILGVLFVMHELRHAAAMQDCVASGRSELRADCIGAWVVFARRACPTPRAMIEPGDAPRTCRFRRPYAEIRRTPVS